jgi:hypothetical protein
MQFLKHVQMGRMAIKNRTILLSPDKQAPQPLTSQSQFPETSGNRKILLQISLEDKQNK